MSDTSPSHLLENKLRGRVGNAQRIDWVDYAKGFCIIFVVMMHSTLGVGDAAGAEGWMHWVVAFAKPFRMPDFFLISGLFLAFAINKPWQRYIDRKVVHFFYFYLLWMTIQFVIKAPGWMGEGLSSTDIIGLYLLSFIEPFGTLWFIYILPVFFVVTRLLKSINMVWLLVAAALLEILPIHTGWLLVDEFAARYVYFLAGYLLAPQIFRLAEWAGRNIMSAVGLLVAWTVVNAALVFMPVSVEASTAFLSWLPVTYDAASIPTSLSAFPIISLMLGGAGAIAIVLTATLLSRLPLAAPLRFLGENSIVIYLAFFLPMAVARVILLKFAPFLDIGTVSLLVTMAAVIGPSILLLMVRWTGIGRFLFERPQWAKLDDVGKDQDISDKRQPKASNPALGPAE